MDFLIKLLILIAICTLVAAIRIFPHRMKGSRHELTGHAQILSRRVDQGNPTAGGLTRWNYKVVFQVGNQELDLYVTQSQYAALKEGLTGQLTWQKENLIDFIPDTM